MFIFLFPCVFFPLLFPFLSPLFSSLFFPLFRPLSPSFALDPHPSLVYSLVSPPLSSRFPKVAALLDYSLSIEPARGQIVLAEAMPPILRHVINGHGVYLVPRSDGKILIGATVEFVGYDKRTTLEGTRQMIEAGIALMPKFGESSFVQTWVGLRPYAKGNPYLGRLPGFDNVIVASGHFKNGILLAPITGKLICELIMTGNPSMPLDPFCLLRD